MRGARLAALVLVMPLLGCEEKAPLPPLRPVVTSRMKAVTQTTFGPFAGTVQPRYESQLGFQLAGRIVARDVYVGDRVKKGQRLAALDPTVTQFALLQAKADVADAKAQLENAQGIEQRQSTLAASRVASQATLDSANAGLTTAKARLDQAEARQRLAQDQLGYTGLHATFDAVVSAWSAEVGQYVDMGRSVVTLARPDVREAVVDIPDDLVGRLSPGMTFTVTLLVAPSVICQAKVREIGPFADDATRSHRVRLTLIDPPSAFRLGTTVTVARRTETLPFFEVPTGALLGDGSKRFVWLLADGGRRVKRRDVSLAPMPVEARDGPAHVAAGLEEGDEVVIIGVHSLVDGRAVAGSVAGLAGGAIASENGIRR